MTDHVGMHKRLLKGDKVILVSENIDQFKIDYDHQNNADVKFVEVENKPNYYKLEL